MNFKVITAITKNVKNGSQLQFANLVYVGRLTDRKHRRLPLPSGNVGKVHDDIRYPGRNAFLLV